jgi:TatA/E family protein of Tat protein translocase
MHAHSYICIIGEKLFTKFGVPGLLIVLAIVVLLFGVDLIGKIAGELGKGIRTFQEGLTGKDQSEQDK